MRSALGKGLDALISEDTVASVTAAAAAKPAGPTALPIHKIQPNSKQPRRTFAPESLNDLASSIKERGVLQPILVTPIADGNFEIIAGERRWRAAQKAGLAEIPAIVRGGSEIERFELALIENIQREDLNPIDLAEGYRRLQDEFRMTQEAISKAVGKDRAVVANTLRLLGLAAEIQQALRDGKISAGHGRALAALESAAAQKELFQRILSDQLPVRAVEQAVKNKKSAERGTLDRAGYETKAPEVRAIEEELQHSLGRKVELHSNKEHKGFLKIEFYSLNDFEALLGRLKKLPSGS